MKKFLLLSLLLFATLGVSRSDEQPPYDVTDPAISENFRNIYLLTDKLSLLGTAFTYDTTTAIFCIDNPTFCVDGNNNTVSQATTTFNGQILIPQVTNQIKLGTTRFVTLTAPTPASTSRTVTFPDLSADYSVVGTEGAQTINGAKTFTSQVYANGGGLLSNMTGGSDLLDVSGTTSGPVNIRIAAFGTSSNAARIRGTLDGTNTNLVFLTGGTTVMMLSGAGEITQVLQPSFLVTNNAGAADITGDGSDYAIVQWTNEIYDQNSDFINSSFTAPVNGRYLLTAGVSMAGLLTTHTVRRMELVTSNRTYATTVNYSLAQTSLGHPIAVVADMDANDIATVHISVDGGTKVVDIENNANKTYFSGTLIN